MTTDQGDPSAANSNKAEAIVGDGLALAVFEKRILPIFQAKKPSSCTECHLSGIELADYIQPNQARTFASLVSVGLIDVEKPDDSKLLQFSCVSTDIWFKLTEVPENHDQMLLQADLYRWTGDGWSEHRVASSDRHVLAQTL